MITYRQQKKSIKSHPHQKINPTHIKEEAAALALKYLKKWTASRWIQKKRKKKRNTTCYFPIALHWANRTSDNINWRRAKEKKELEYSKVLKIKIKKKKKNSLHWKFQKECLFNLQKNYQNIEWKKYSKI